jgi:error-prone DNA polymerase
MPEEPQPKHVQHPSRSLAASVVHVPHAGRRDRPFGEPLVLSNHSFLAGASHPEELVREAARLGHAGIAITDIESVGGAVRAHVAARESSIRLAHGARVKLDIHADIHADTHADTHAGADDGSIGGTRDPRVPPHVAAGATAQLELALYATDRASWGALCRLLSHRFDQADLDEACEREDNGRRGASSRRRRPRSVHEFAETLLAHPGGRGLLAVAIPPPVPDQRFLEAFQGISAIMGSDRMAVALCRSGEQEGVADAECACALADALGLPVVASGDVRMHSASRRPLLDTLLCIGAGVPVQRAGRLLSVNAERRLRAPTDVLRRYDDRPDAIEAAWRLIDRAAGFSLSELRYEYPDEVVPRELAAQGWTAMEYLRSLVWKGARERYPRGVPPKVARQFEHEFAIIADLGYAPYFLTVHEIVAFARSRGILCQGRGAAANSAVCYALGITAVDPDRVDVLFERFVSRERNEPPDIDIDFEHERREEVIQHIYATYGRERAALVCEVISYRGRSAVRDVGKALGFAPDAVDRLAREVDRWGGGGLGTRDEITEEHAAADDGLQPLPKRASERMRAAGLDPRAPLVARYARLVDEILGFPRHRSQHVGGFVISRGPLVETVPIERAAMEDRTIIEWDKDDIEALGMLKIDVLALGMLTAIRKAIDLVNGDFAAIGAGASATRVPDAPAPRADLAEVSPPALVHEVAFTQPAPLRFHSIPPEDPATYDMVCRADTVGVFQIESRAQMSMLPRLKPRCFYDLVVEVAIVRPGPIQGDMVHPYLRRRSGEEAIEYPDDAIRKVLGKTLGVPLFQEQAMSLAVVAAGFTPGQADALRRAIAAWKRHGNQIAQFGEALEAGMMARGYSRRFATQVFEQIKGFSGYGFPESHAASFALLVYASAWLKRHHPAAFAAALLNSQPMGFYAPAQIIRDARDHGVSVRAVDVHCSRWDTTLERGIDLAGEMARSCAHGDGASERSCRRTQRELDEASLRMRAGRGDGLCPHGFHLHVRQGGIGIGGLVEHWNERWMPLVPAPAVRETAPSAEHARESAADGGPKCAPMVRVHSRGRSVAVRCDSDAAVVEEPLCAPSAIADPCEDRRTDPNSSSAGPEPRPHVPSQPAIRLGLRMVRGLEVDEAHRIVDAIAAHGACASIAELHARSGVGVATLRRLAAADAFGSMGLDRQQAAWQILALRDRERPLWSVPAAEEPERALPDVPELSGIAQDLDATGVSLKRHPISCLRSRLVREGAVPCSWLRDERRAPAGRRISVAGVVLVRQRPSTAKGIVFMTIEDEAGTANLILRPKAYARLRSRVRHAVVLLVHGKVERRDGVVHVLVADARDLTAELAEEGGDIGEQSRDFR